MTHSDRQKWDDRYSGDPHWQADRAPLPWMVEHAPRSDGGFALDVACGLGQNAIWLAGQGYRVVAADGSRVALRRALTAAHREGMSEHTLFVQADMDSFRPPQNFFDLICVIRFLNRDLFPCLAAALRPGGALIVATLNWQWAHTHPDVAPLFLLQPGELLAAFPTLRVIDHCEQDGMSYLLAGKIATDE